MIKIKCNKCYKKYEFEDNYLVVHHVGSDERSMGTENEFLGTIEFECKNDSCKNPIIAEFNFWEYPMMAINYSEYSEDGCVVIEEPDYQSYIQE